MTPLYPAANGGVERQNRSLLKRIKIAQAEKKDWKKELRIYLRAYYSTPHSVTGIAPPELMFKRKIKTKLPEFREKVEINEDEVRDRDQLYKEKSRIYTDTKRSAKESEIKPGDVVLLQQQKQNKLSATYANVPYEVI